MLCVLALAAVGACSGGSGSAPGAVERTLLVTPTGNDANNCARESPCSSFNRAYMMAAPGQVVEVATGTYGQQELRIDQEHEKPGAKVLFRPEQGAQVVTGEIVVHGGSVEFRRMTVGGVKTMSTAHDVIFRNLTNTAGIFILSSQRVKVIGGSAGPGVDYHPIIGADTATPPRDIVIDGVHFHDWTRSNDSVHTECLQIAAGDRITIRNNRFQRCAVMSMHVTMYGPAGAPKNLTIENNFFDRGIGGYHAVVFAGYPEVWSNILVRHNSSLQPITIEPQPRKENFRVIGNVAPLALNGCMQGVTYLYNVWDGAKCAPTDVNRPSGFVNPEALDLRLTPRAAAIDRVKIKNKKDYPLYDIEGQKRPRGKFPDAGADELR